ncbi:MAG: hypothetical protein QXQ57_02150 [Sulfolobales archaeon]
MGTSLISVGIFSLASGLEYSLYGKTLYEVAIAYVLGGVIGGY